VELGHIHIFWNSYFGERNKFIPKPISYTRKTAQEIQLRIIEKPSRLTMEEPSLLKLRIINASNSTFKYLLNDLETFDLEVSIGEVMNTILINGISNNVKIITI
jgi:hypothetical protein